MISLYENPRVRNNEYQETLRIKNIFPLKEYGSNVQKLVEHIVAMEDRTKRTLYAHILVELMKQIHPNMRDNQDYTNKLWDDLYIISGFELDVDAPYPPPSKELLGKRPQPVDYNQHSMKYRHYGRNVELLVQKASEIEDKEERLAFVSYIFRLMKSFYSTWNRENPEDVVLLEHLEDIAQGRIHEELEYIRANGPIESAPIDRNVGPADKNKANQIGYQSQQPQRVHQANRNRHGKHANHTNYRPAGNKNRRK